MFLLGLATGAGGLLAFECLLYLLFLALEKGGVD
jgi:hypothetical protein